MAIHLPQLALEAALDSSLSRRRERDALTPTLSRPVAVIDPGSRQQTVLASNQAARAAGVRPGQSLNAAIALASELTVLPRDETREHERLVRLAAWCQQRITPLVSLEPADELLLEVKGSLRLFGGARALLERIAAGLRERGVAAHLALTPTPRSALWLARSGPARGQGEGVAVVASIEKPAALTQHLAAVSLRCLRWPDELLAQLLSMGLRTVGDLMRLPRGGMVRRLGPAWLEELDRALGRRADVRHGFRAPERFDARRALDQETETTAGLTPAFAPLLAGLQDFLRQRQAAIAMAAVQLEHRTHPCTHLRVGLAAPSSDVGHLRALLDERLIAASLPAPVIAIRLRSGAILPAAPASGWLWKNERASARSLGDRTGVHSLSQWERAGVRVHSLSQWERVGVRGTDDALPRLLERLRARLGNEAVFGVRMVEDHRPERAWRVIETQVAEEKGKKGKKGKEVREKGEEGVRRPLWLLAEPRRLPFTSLPFPSSPFSPFQLLRGPERIETGWWDGHEVTRDYFVARDAQGVRLWIYRNRRAPQEWYVHGLFG